MPVPATFSGIQDGFGHLPAIELYTLLVRVGEHPAGSTVSRQTLEQHGFRPRPRRRERKGRRWSGGKAA